MAYIKDHYVSFYGEESKTMALLDKTFLSFVGERPIEEFHIPALIDETVLERCGYISAFPNQLILASAINQGDCEEVIKNKGVKRENLNPDQIKYLTPAACLHIYPMLEDHQSIQDKIITVKGRVYRYETKIQEMVRLWDFTVREIVFIGEEAFVKENLQMMKQKTLELAQKISPEAKIEAATDNFYPSRSNKILEKMQKTNQMKEELIIPIQDALVACGSFNFHNYHFSKEYKFDNEGKIVSGCAAFGLERWMAACLAYDYRF